MFWRYLNIESLPEFVYFQIDMHVYIFYFFQMQIHSEDPVIMNLLCISSVLYQSLRGIIVSLNGITTVVLVLF